MIEWMIATLLVSSAIFLPYAQLHAKYYLDFEANHEQPYEIISVRDVDGFYGVYFILIRNQWYNIFHAYAISKNDPCIKDGKIINLKELTKLHHTIEYELAESIFTYAELSPYNYFEYVIF